MPASQSETEVQKAGMISLAICGKNLNPGQTVLELCTPCPSRPDWRIGWWLTADNTGSLAFLVFLPGTALEADKTPARGHLVHYS